MLAYNDRGNGFPLLLIHGFCESKEVWKFCEQELSKEFRVIVPDLPGFGESRSELSPVSMDYFSGKIIGLLDELRIEKAIVIGHSLGGYVALALAEKHEHRLAGFGLFHSTAFADTEEKKENRNKTIDFIKKHGVKSFAESFVPPLFALSERERLKGDIKELIAIASNSSEEGVLETTAAMRDRPDRRTVLENSKVPILFVVGKQDGAVTLDKSLEQCYLPKRSLTYFMDGTGHMGMIEQKEDSVKIIRAFCKICI